MNTLPLRIRLSVEGVAEAVRRTHEQLTELLRHEHASLALAQRCSSVAAPAPLFSALLNYRHSPARQEISDGSAIAWEANRAASIRGTHQLSAFLVGGRSHRELPTYGPDAEPARPKAHLRLYEHRSGWRLVEALEHSPIRRRRGPSTFCRRTNAIACWWNGTTPRRTIRRTGFCTRCSRRRRRGTRRLSRWSMKARSSPMAS
ncbi:hypothetical protein [Methylocapsa aurea]|uniref:hypothetical protein n=1 Tax=Methylocapsa aurea TaxID=663610 RepID=UPI003D18992B